jgi:beta-galactosidase
MTMQRHSLSTHWLFTLGDNPDGNWPKNDNPSWRTVDLPHDWSVELPRIPTAPSGDNGGFFQGGRGLYRKIIEAPKDWGGKKVFVEFEGVYMNAEVWLNDDFLGRHPYGYTSFHFDLTPYLKVGETNELRVKVDNACHKNSRWYSGSGIYRPVSIYVADPLHISLWGVYVTTPQVTPEMAVVKVVTRLENESDAQPKATVQTRIYSPDGALVAETESRVEAPTRQQAECVQELQVATPTLWSVETPRLYRLESELRIRGRVIDSTTTTFGIRSIEFSAAKGFLLNGHPVKLKGGCVHHDNGVLGAASYARAEERKVELHKANGFNAIRCAHNPPSPSFLDACDRLGMLVIDETFDCWREGKNSGDYHLSFDDWWRRDLDSMLYRDRNHPCIIVWSIGNEVLEREGRSNGVATARMLAARVRAVDPTRPVTSALCGSWGGKNWELTDSVFSTLDVGGYNYQWKMYEPDHVRYPKRIMMGTESFPIEAFENWQQVMNNSHVIGDFVWTSLDYLGESGIGRVHFDEKNAHFLGEFPWHQANCGDIDICGFKRPQSYYRDILWQVGSPLYIAVHQPIPEGKTPIITQWGWPDVIASWTWPGQEGKKMQVDVYSACEQVELFLNGKSLGKKTTGTDEKHTATFEVSYKPGELKVVGYKAKKEAESFSLQTSGMAKSIRLSADRQGLKAGDVDLCYVTVEVVDENGIVVPQAANDIFFTTAGAGRIAAVGSSHTTSTESYTGNQRKAHHGRCLVVVKSNGESGELRLRANADGLDGAEVTLRVA